VERRILGQYMNRLLDVGTEPQWTGLPGGSSQSENNGHLSGCYKRNYWEKGPVGRSNLQGLHLEASMCLCSCS
jgi:hypothetical protein